MPGAVGTRGEPPRSTYRPPHPRRPSQQPTPGSTSKTQVTMNPRLGASPSRSRSLCVLLPDQPVRAAPHFRWQTANLPTTAAKALLGATPVHDAAVCGRSRYPRHTPIHHAQTRVRFEPKRRTLRAHQLLRAHLKEGVVSSRSNLRAQQQAHHRNKKQLKERLRKAAKTRAPSLACRTCKSNT